jgi:tetratricopeptide (TPR) repeat protein
MGAAAEAASYLYEQFDAKGIFTSQFFLDDEKFLHGADGTAAENCNTPFLAANNRARAMAKRALKTEPNNVHALLVLTIADGMESNYDAMIVKKQMAGLGLMRQAEAEANKLLAIDPDAKDAYLALGASNYVIGNLPGFKRAFLWFGGIHGDKNRGIQQMQLAADQGHYLKPFAKIMLALAYEREHQIDLARPLLASLVDEFPTNPLYAHELSLIDHPTGQ